MENGLVWIGLDWNETEMKRKKTAKTHTYTQLADQNGVLELFRKNRESNMFSHTNAGTLCRCECVNQS